MRERFRPPHYPVFPLNNDSEDNFVNSTPSPPYRSVPSTSQLVLDPSSPPYRSESQITLASAYEMDVYKPRQGRHDSGDSHPSDASVTQAGTQKPSVHYPEDINSPPTPSYFNGLHKPESRPSSDEEGEEDEFDWSGDEDLQDEEAKFEKKMGVKIKSPGWGIVR
jgi:hypothetical protein